MTRTPAASDKELPQQDHGNDPAGRLYDADEEVASAAQCGRAALRGANEAGARYPLEPDPFAIAIGLGFEAHFSSGGLRPSTGYFLNRKVGSAATAIAAAAAIGLLGRDLTIQRLVAIAARGCTHWDSSPEAACRTGHFRTWFKLAVANSKKASLLGCRVHGSFLGGDASDLGSEQVNHFRCYCTKRLSSRVMLGEVP
jgi:hypothetical protein